jgi:hypothetical protein
LWQLDEFELSLRMFAAKLPDHLPADELAWTDRLVEAGNQIKEAARSSDPDAAALIDRSIIRVERLLDQRMRRINTMIVETYGSMRLDALIAQLRSLSGGVVFSNFDEPLGALERLGKDVGDLVNSHDAWQQFDAVFQRLDTAGPEELFGMVWPDVRSGAAGLRYPGEGEERVIQKSIQNIAAAVEKEDWPRALRAFRMGQRNVDLAFRRIDQQLLQAIGKLWEAVRPIQDVLNSA